MGSEMCIRDRLGASVTGNQSRRMAPQKMQTCQHAHGMLPRVQGSSHCGKCGHTKCEQTSQRVGSGPVSVSFGNPGPVSLRTMGGRFCLFGHGSVDSGMLNMRAPRGCARVRNPMHKTQSSDLGAKK